MNGPEEIIIRPVADLVPYARNARTHSEGQVAQIARSIQEFGFNNPILTRGDAIVAGHGRLQAALMLNLPQVPTLDLSHLTEAQARAYTLADNQLALMAGWDEEILTLELQELELEGIDLDLLGFPNLDELMNPEPAGGLQPGTDEDAVPDAPKKAITKPGDIITLGRHRLMCGDSTVITDVERLMDGAKVDMVFTDPPYRMEVEGGSNQPIGRAARKLGEMIKHLCEFDPVAFLGTLSAVFDNGKMNAYVFCNKDLVPDYLNWAVSSGYSFNILFWKKPNAIPLGGSHRPDTEYLLLFRRSAIWNNAVEGVNYSKCLEFSRELSKDHPTLKPVGLISNELLISSNAGSLVLDLFGGSGSTLIAAEKTGRTAYLMELDPIYCDVIVNRWEQATGQKAVRP